MDITKKINVGDHIKSIENTSGFLTLGKSYFVIDVLDSGDVQLVIIRDDEGSVENYYSYRFELDIGATRNEVINNILE